MSFAGSVIKLGASTVIKRVVFSDVTVSSRKMKPPPLAILMELAVMGPEDWREEVGDPAGTCDTCETVSFSTPLRY